MMSSLAVAPRIDHRTVYKSLQSEANKKHHDSTTADVFNPLKSNTTASSFTKSRFQTHSTKIPQLFNISPRTYIQHRAEVSNLSHKTKIPYPLTTVWSKQKPNHFRRSSSLRTPGTKSNLPLIMEPTTNETPTKSSTTVNEEKSNETIAESSATVDGLQASASRKLIVTQQTDVNVVEHTTLIKRSSSLRKNIQVSPNNNSNSIDNKTDISENKLCAAANLNSSLLHDVTTITQQCDDINTTTPTTATPSIISAASEVDKQNSAVTELAKDFSNMSLNRNSVSTTAAATTTTATTNSSLATTTLTQQTRPLTLNTSISAAKTTTSKGLRSPKTPAQSSAGNQTPIGVTQSQNITASQRKTSSGSKSTPKTPPVTPDSPSTYLDDDLDSQFSYGTTTSGRSTMSCEHPYVARNGTTFSGRKMKYVVHCSNYAGQVGTDYLTPTQRAQQQLRRLKEMLCAARQDIEQRDSEILRLTREVAELRLFKASLSSPEERSASSDAVTVREAELKTSQDVSPIVDMVDDAQKTSSPRRQAHTSSITLQRHHLPQQHHNMLHLSSDMQSSFADSGHFEDMTSSSVHSKDSSSYTPPPHSHDQNCDNARASYSPNTSGESATTLMQYELQRQELIQMYEQRIEDLIRNQDAATSEIKRTNCDRIEALLQKLAECNTRYADIVPDYEHAKERIRELEKQLEELQRRLVEHEEKQKQMYLHMYQKGQEAERIARADQALELAHRAPQNRVSVNELLHQLQSTQDELENIRAAECRKECGNNHALLTAKEAISLWVLGARKTIYRRLLEAQKNRTHVDPEVTLQFLKSAVYYFLTDKENSQGHLQAIESILEFSEAEKQTINKARSAK